MAEDKPPLDAETWEDIETKKHAVKKSYVRTLAVLLEDLPSLFLDPTRIGDGLPPPPKQPLFLQKKLGEYAVQLFDIEAFLYPKDGKLTIWVQHLAQRVEKEVIGHAARMRGKSQSFGPLRYGGNLSYHATLDQMKTAVRDALKPRISLFKSPRDFQTSGQIPTEQVATHPLKSGAEQPFPPVKKKRMPSTVTSSLAARRMEYFLKTKGIGQTEFATTLGVTDRNLRTFRATGKIKRVTFDEIADKMGTTRDKLLDPTSGIPS